MDHNYSETSQKIKGAESLKPSHPQSVKSGFKEPKIIKYTGGVSLASGERGGLVFQRLNNVSTFQKIFQASNALPVHLKKGKNDELIYKGLMTASVVSLVVAAFSIYKLAMPSRPK